MAYQEQTLINNLKQALNQISVDVRETFSRTGDVLSADVVNEKLAQAIVAVLTKFKDDADITINTQQLSTSNSSQIELTNTDQGITGSITIPQHTGKIT